MARVPRPQRTVGEQIKLRRNWVRVLTTYGAGLYIVIGSLALIAANAFTKAADLSLAKEIFTLVLPVATGIITYWFASRQPDQSDTTSRTGTSDPEADAQGQRGENREADDDGGNLRKPAVEEVEHDPQSPEEGEGEDLTGADGSAEKRLENPDSEPQEPKTP